MDLQPIILKNIQRIRKEKGLSQEYISEQMGIDSSTYSNIETGKVKLTFHRADEIADIIGESLQTLMTDPDNGISPFQMRELGKELPEITGTGKKGRVSIVIEIDPDQLNPDINEKIKELMNSINNK